MSRTTYKVLFLDGNTWLELDGAWEATSPKGAIRAALQAANGSAGGTLVAVPTRSWQPMPVKVETQQRLKIG